MYEPVVVAIKHEHALRIGAHVILKISSMEFQVAESGRMAVPS
jgi:hypothetical protein